MRDWSGPSSGSVGPPARSWSTTRSVPCSRIHAGAWCASIPASWIWRGTTASSSRPAARHGRSTRARSSRAASTTSSATPSPGAPSATCTTAIATCGAGASRPPGAGSTARPSGSRSRSSTRSSAPPSGRCRPRPGSWPSGSRPSSTPTVTSSSPAPTTRRPHRLHRPAPLGPRHRPEGRALPRVHPRRHPSPRAARPAPNADRSSAAATRSTSSCRPRPGVDQRAAEIGPACARVHRRPARRSPARSPPQRPGRPAPRPALWRRAPGGRVRPRPRRRRVPLPHRQDHLGPRLDQQPLPDAHAARARGADRARPATPAPGPPSSPTPVRRQEVRPMELTHQR